MGAVIRKMSLSLLPSPSETLLQSTKSDGCHAEQSEASRIFRRLRSRDSSAAPQNDIANQSFERDEISERRTGCRKNQLIRRLAKIFAVIVLTFLLPFELVHAQPLTKIRVANIGGTSDHIQVAINGGIYRKHGFDVENIQVGSSATVVQSLIAGEVSFAHVGAVPVVAAVSSGIDLKIIAVFINRFNYVMVTLPDLQKPQDLRGKTLAISRLGSGDEFATREALRRWGLDPDKDVRLLQVGLTMARLAALQGRHVQASLLSPPQIVEVQRMGLNVMADLTDLDVEYAHYTLVTKGSLILENRPFVDRFMKAYVDGIKFYRSHPEAAIPYLRKFSKQSDAELRIVYDNLRKRYARNPCQRLAACRRSSKAFEAIKKGSSIPAE
jgi:NitT/TauT family transport system substrate-binding protein